jgi:hypothetical protein
MRAPIFCLVAIGKDPGFQPVVVEELLSWMKAR